MKSRKIKNMVRRKDIEAEINGYLKALSDFGFPFEKAILFGSFSKGNPHDYSDIDLAVWSVNFQILISP
ncbi:MAG: nucleotidyltransferase domain-containing protein [Ginsengibacter sp.]